MDDLITIPRTLLESLEQRARKLAGEKSRLQLVNDLMNNLSAEPGLDKTVRRILCLIADYMGGNNVALFYRVEDKIHYADIFGNQAILAEPADNMVRRAFESGRTCVEQQESSATDITTPELTASTDWTFPLAIGDTVLGVLKLDGMPTAGAEFRNVLQPFLNYAALVLKHEIENYSRLQEAYQQLQNANQSLQREMDERYRQQQFMQTVLDSIEAGIVTCDANGMLTMFNRKAREIHGLPAELLPPEQWAKHYSLYRSDGKSLLPKEENPLFRALQGERISNMELIVRHKNGDKKVLLISGQRIRGKDGQCCGAVVALNDVTELKTLEVQLRHAQKLEAVGQLAAGIAHEINTPSQFVGDNLQFLQNAFRSLQTVISTYREGVHSLSGAPQWKQVCDKIALQEKSADLSFLEENVPSACSGALEGISRLHYRFGDEGVCASRTAGNDHRRSQSSTQGNSDHCPE